MTIGPEFTHVGQPFIDQLVRMVRKHSTGNIDHHGATSGTGFWCTIRQELETYP